MMTMIGVVVIGARISPCYSAELRAENHWGFESRQGLESFL
jgi:hypothetical protein